MIKIAPAAKDTCGKCWEYKRQIQSQDRRSIEAAAGDNEENNERNAMNLPECPTDGLERSERQDAIDNALIAKENNAGFTVASMSTGMPSLQPLINDNGDNTVATNNSNYNVALYSNITSVSELNTQVAASCRISEPTEQEDTVSIWKQHCNEFSSQRRYVQKLSLEAKSDLECNIPWTQRRVSFCSDYCQNMDLPRFGSEQPGETYYYSP